MGCNTNRLTVLPNTAYTSINDSVDKTEGIGMQGPSFSRALLWYVKCLWVVIHSMWKLNLQLHGNTMFIDCVILCNMQAGYQGGLSADCMWMDRHLLNGDL